MTNRLKDYEKGVVINDTPGGQQSLTTVSEGGLNRIIAQRRDRKGNESIRRMIDEFQHGVMGAAGELVGASSVGAAHVTAPSARSHRLACRPRAA